MKKFLGILSLLLILTSCGSESQNLNSGINQDPQGNNNPSDNNSGPGDFWGKANGIEVDDLKKFITDKFTMYAYDLVDSGYPSDGDLPPISITFKADGTFSTLKAPPLFDYTFKTYHADDFYEAIYGPGYCAMPNEAPDGEEMYFFGKNNFYSDLKIKWEIIETEFNPILRITQSFISYPYCGVTAEYCEYINNCLCCGFNSTPISKEISHSYVINAANDSGFSFQMGEDYNYYIIMLK